MGKRIEIGEPILAGSPRRAGGGEKLYMLDLILQFRALNSALGQIYNSTRYVL